MEFLKVGINIIEKIEEMTCRNPNFKVEHWCEYDAAVLRRVSDFICRELKDAKKKGASNVPR